MKTQSASRLSVLVLALAAILFTALCPPKAKAASAYVAITNNPSWQRCKLVQFVIGPAPNVFNQTNSFPVTGLGQTNLITTFVDGATNFIACQVVSTNDLVTRNTNAAECLRVIAVEPASGTTIVPVSYFVPKSPTGGDSILQVSRDLLVWNERFRIREETENGVEGFLITELTRAVGDQAFFRGQAEAAAATQARLQAIPLPGAQSTTK